MNAELKTKWIAALRSGKYLQGKHFLERDGHFCCLGVLCKVADWPVEDLKGIITSASYKPVLAELGETTARTLTSMNDGHDNTFEQIAEYIEAHL